MFECIFSQYITAALGMLSIFRASFCLSRNLSPNGCQGAWEYLKDYVLPFLAGVAWAVWKNRNKMALEKNFPLNPDVVVHMAINFLQIWADLCRENDKIKMRKMEQCLSDWMCHNNQFGSYSDIIVV